MVAVDLHETVGQRLRGVGQRYTGGRRRLVDRLAGAERPATVEDLVRGGDRLPSSSAYRNLAVLEQAGVVHRIVGTDTFARFELAEDLTEHHHHLICSACGGVEDFTVPPSLERALARVAGEVARRFEEGGAGFTTATHRLDLIGTCTACTACT